MPRFRAVALDAQGKERQEELDANTESEAMATLRGQKLTVVELRLIAQATQPSVGPVATKQRFQKRVPISVVLSFYEQLSFLIKAGIPIYQAISMLSDTLQNAALLQILKQVLFDLSEGALLSTALQKYSDSFPLLHTNLIGVGEKSGNLDGALGHLGDLVKEQQDIKERVIKAAAYPVFLLVMSLSLVVGLLFFIFPKFEDIFNSFHVKLPVVTEFLINTSDYMRAHGIMLFSTAGLVLFGIIYFLQADSMSEIRDKLFLKTPLIRDIFISMFIALFAKTLANVLKAGIPLMEGLGICQSTIHGKLKMEFFEKLIATVKEGEPVSKAMEGSLFIPELARQLILVGETTGHIDMMMDNIFSFYKKRYNERLQVTTAVLQPLLMFFAAGLIAVVAISLFLPLFKLSSSIRGQG